MALDNGCYVNCYITSKDLQNAEAIYGPCMVCTESKMKNLMKVTIQDPIAETWYIDLHHLNPASLGGNTQLLVLVSNNPGIVQIVPLKVKTSECIERALLGHIAEVKANGHNVKKYIMDHEAILLQRRHLWECMESKG
jgi:hypothetical protein